MTTSAAAVDARAAGRTVLTYFADTVARKPGQVALRRRVGMALVVVGQMLPEGAIKGGSAMALRYGRGTRFTQDLDAARVQPLAKFRSDFEDIIMPRARQVFGTEPDVDANGRIALVFSRLTREQGVAFFNACDLAGSFEGCQALIGRLKAAGGQAQMVGPPEIGTRGNSHMIMQDRNHLQVADLILKWIGDRVGKPAGAGK